MNCPRCQAKLISLESCVICGWAGPTREPTRADQPNTGARIRGRFVQTGEEKVYVRET